MAELYTYDWKYEGESARFTVDLALSSEAASGAYPFIFRLDCRTNKDGELTKRALRHVDAMQSAAQKEALLFAGRVETDTRALLYLYGKSRVSLSSLEYVYEKERLLDCYADVQEDTAWSFYTDFLYPDAAKMQTEENRKLIARIQKAGDNIAASRRVNLHMFFPSEPLLTMFSQQARQSGYAIAESEFIPEMETPYGIVIVRVSTLQKADVDALTTHAIYLAKPFEGVLCYWNCPIIPKNHPLR